MICMHTPCFDKGGHDFAECFRLAAQAGFDCVLLSWYDKDGQDFRTQPEFARRAGLQIENIHTPFKIVNGIWEDTAAGQAVFDICLRCVDDCAAYEIPAMVVHPSFGFENLPPRNELGLDRFKRIVDRAEGLGVNVAMENMLRPEGIARAAWLLESIDSPRFGLCYDSGHQHARFVQTPDTDLLARFGHRLMALHLHDNNGTKDQHLLPFDGTIDWPAQMKAIAETGYRGPLSLEVEARPPYEEGAGLEEFLARAYERVKRLEALRHA